jgi:lysophospholipase L1-like esterase
VLLIGDSIAERIRMKTIYGLPVFNAGAAGAFLADWKDATPRLARTLRPRIVIIALGTNDGLRNWKFSPEQWQATYQEIVQGTPAAAHILVPPPSSTNARLYQGRLQLMRRIIAGMANIGSRNRLDFTVIGPAVNEIGRIWLVPNAATIAMSGARLLNPQQRT